MFLSFDLKLVALLTLSLITFPQGHPLAQDPGLNEVFVIILKAFPKEQENELNRPGELSQIWFKSPAEASATLFGEIKGDKLNRFVDLAKLLPQMAKRLPPPRDNNSLLIKIEAEENLHFQYVDKIFNFCRANGFKVALVKPAEKKGAYSLPNLFKSQVKEGSLATGKIGLDLYPSGLKGPGVPLQLESWFDLQNYLRNEISQLRKAAGGKKLAPLVFVLQAHPEVKYKDVSQVLWVSLEAGFRKLEFKQLPLPLPASQKE